MASLSTDWRNLSNGFRLGSRKVFAQRPMVELTVGEKLKGEGRMSMGRKEEGDGTG